MTPLAKLCRRPLSNPFLNHYYDQAKAAFVFLLLLFLAVCLFDTGQRIVFVRLAKNPA